MPQIIELRPKIHTVLIFPSSLPHSPTPSLKCKDHSS